MTNDLLEKNQLTTRKKLESIQLSEYDCVCPLFFSDLAIMCHYSAPKACKMHEIFFGEIATSGKRKRQTGL